MTLRKPLFASLAILALAVPVTGGAIVTFTASPALAKGGNGKGGSDRGSRGGRDKSQSDRGSRGGSGRGSTGNGNGNGNGFGNGNGGGGGNGNGNGQGNGQSGNVTPAKAAAVEPETADGELALRPNQLGSMNGAMHANINAVLAHIRNGNTNGPVGALAGLAVADHDAAEAEGVIETAAVFETLDETLEAAGYDTLQDYLDSGETDGDIDAALAALGDLTEEDRPSEDEITEAQDAIDALPEAEAAIFDAWNKSGEATEEEKAALLDALRDRLEGDSALIDAALAEAEDAGSQDEDGEDTADGTEDETDESGEGDGEGEDTAALDPETAAMIAGLKF
ncbi:MAG: hypothetical protein KDK53_11540 [Maritimibacter sp.]|nr:hypothetical protein [Maritimibacter sp.]MCB2111601.1 hypothetical protein [Paracoccaceae bacterium]